MQHAPQPRLAEIGIGSAPDRESFAPEVEDEHLVVRNSGEKCLYLRVVPEAAFVIEHPSLHYPHRFRIYFRHSVVYFRTHAAEICRVAGRRLVLVKGVGGVEMVSAVNLGLCLQEELAYGREHLFRRVQNESLREVNPIGVLELDVRVFFHKRRRNVSGEGRQDGSHTQRPFLIENLLLQLFVPFHKALWKRATPTIQITHPEPVEIGRAAEECFQVLVRQAKLMVNPAPDGVLSRDGEGHIDAVKCHPVDFLLPSVEVPPAHTVVKRTIVQVVAVFER